MKRYHIGYYLAQDKKMISGKTYIAENILHAIEQYLIEEKSESLIKYVVEMDEYVTNN